MVILCLCDIADVMWLQDEQKNLISCSTAGEDKWTEGGGTPIGGPGLVSGHAYTLLQARVTSTGQQLVQLRNPWGDFEWNGDWSGMGLLLPFGDSC